MGLSLKTNIVIISLVFGILDLLVIAGRFYARQKNRVQFSLDDYLIVPGALAAVTIVVITVLQVYKGNLGGHLQFTPEGVPADPKGLEVFYKLEFANQLVSIVGLTFTKQSILVFYRRIFRGPKFSIVSWILIGLVSCWGIAFFFATLFECYPISQAWTTSYGQPGRNCYNYVPMFYGTAISNFIIDLLILAVPQPIVWKLQLPAKQKVGVSAIFFLGAFVCGISIARIYFFFTSGYADVTYGIAPTLYWTMLELTIAVICACLPTMAPTFAKIGSTLQSLYTSIKSLTGSLTGSTVSDTSSERANLSEKHRGDTPIPGINQFPNHSSAASIRGGCPSDPPPIDRWDLPQDDVIGVHTIITSNEEKV